MNGLSTSLKAARTSQALAAVLLEEGLDRRDFEAEEDSAPLVSDSSFVIGPLLKVRCLSTHQERTYSIGSGYTWLRPFISDLRNGHFARAARRVRS